ncbi:unnamed protein product [Paramecium sonneborni]|uniref:Uncharacterized protein n=1 Tax=Paramecium sonneborni TaxID=65129 RepID=A0A8S1R7J1_9CILI|nr:unnamed protein product [Paramecium sonneborni]
MLIILKTIWFAPLQQELVISSFGSQQTVQNVNDKLMKQRAIFEEKLEVILKKYITKVAPIKKIKAYIYSSYFCNILGQEKQ